MVARKDSGIDKTLKYMKSKQYKKIIANAQEEFKSICNRDVQFFNMGKECFRGYVLRMIDEKIQSYKNISLNDTIIKTDCLEELKEVLEIKK